MTRGNSARQVGKPAKPNGAEGAKGEARPGGHTDPDKEEQEGIDKIMAKLTSMEINFIDIRKDLREGFQTTEFKIAELDDKVKAAKTTCEEKKETIREVTDTAGLKTRSEVHGARLTGIEQKIEQVERVKRRNIIIVEGVRESENNLSPEIVEQLFRDLKLGFNTLVCDRIYRRGKEPPATTSNRKKGLRTQTSAWSDGRGRSWWDSNYYQTRYKYSNI